MKKIISALILMLFACNVQSASFLDNTLFGVSIIKQDVEFDLKLPGLSGNVTESGTGFGIYIDKYYKRTYRLNSTLSYVRYDLFDLTSLSLSADYLIPYNKQYSFFVGASAGAGMQTFSDSSVTDASVGLLYGVQFGGIAYLNKSLMMELGYRQKVADIETEVSNVNGTILADEVSELYLNFLLIF